MEYDIAESGSPIGATWKEVTSTLMSKESQFSSCVLQPHVCIGCDEQSTPWLPLEAGGEWDGVERETFNFHLPYFYTAWILFAESRYLYNNKL